MKNKIVFKNGAMWDESFWELHFNFECTDYGGGVPCKHCTDIKTHEKEIPYTTVKEKTWIVPRLVIGYNQSQHDSVGICADCIAGAIAKIDKK